MNLTKLALKRPVSCFLVILALAVFGISSIFGFISRQPRHWRIGIFLGTVRTTLLVRVESSELR